MHGTSLICCSVAALGALLLVGCSSASSSSAGPTTGASASSPSGAAGAAGPTTHTTSGPGSSVTSPDATTTTSTTPTTAPVHAQGKLAGVPAQCPSPDDITLAVHVSLPHVYGTDVSGALNCTYYTDGSQGSPGLNIIFGALPSGTTVASWEAGTKNANPTAVFVPGVGDAAFYFTLGPPAPTGLNFISGGVACNMYTADFTADQPHLVALAESILEG